MAKPTYSTSRVITLVGALALAVCVLALVAMQKPAKAAFPGGNGKIAVTKGLPSTDFVDEIFTMNPNGTEVERLTHNSVYDYDPAWSPNGKQIAFSRGGDNPGRTTEVYIMRAEGSKQKALTSTPGKGENWNPTWSPNGKRIAFQTNRHVSAENDINTEIYTVRVNGKKERRLTKNTALDINPDWSPDGSKIAFYTTRYSTYGDIAVMNADGSNPRRVTSGFAPEWSPDGSRIAFSGGGHIYTVRPDGTKLQNLTNSEFPGQEFSGDPSWSPDGTLIAYSGRRVLYWNGDWGEYITEGGIYLNNPDGTAERRIPGTESFSGTYGLDWQPLP